MNLRDEVIRAFSKTPHPRDDSLRSCDCDECQYDVRWYKGKKWSQLKWDELGNEDDFQANIHALTPAAFHYFLPGLILLAFDHNEEDEFIAISVVDRFVVSDLSRGERLNAEIEHIRSITRRHTSRQKQTLIDVFNHWRPSVSHAPPIWEAAISNIRGPDVKPYSSEEHDRWFYAKYGPDILRLPGSSNWSFSEGIS